MKFVKIAGVTSIVVIALIVLGVTLAFAQKPSPSDFPGWNSMRAMMQGSGVIGISGMMGSGGMMGGNGGMGAIHEWMHQSSGLHTIVWNSLARQLGMTSAELTAQINNGRTLAQLAQEKGVSATELAATIENMMKAGLVQAVSDGKLTQEQADQVLKHMEGQYEWMITNMGAGMMGTGSGGMMGSGSGGCHDNNQPNAESTSL